MSRESERLLDIAKRLDDLSDELGSGELRTLAEEIGEITDQIKPQEFGPANKTAEMPRYLFEIQRIVEQMMRDSDPYGIRPEDRYGAQYRRMMMDQVRVALPPLDPSAFVAIKGV